MSVVNEIRAEDDGIILSPVTDFFARWKGTIRRDGKHAFSMLRTSKIKIDVYDDRVTIYYVLEKTVSCANLKASLNFLWQVFVVTVNTTRCTEKKILILFTCYIITLNSFE